MRDKIEFKGFLDKILHKTLMLYNSLNVLKTTEMYKLNCVICDLYLSKAVTKY